MLFKEGGIMPGDFGLASIFSLSRGGGRTYIKDIIPSKSPMVVNASFPFRAILGQNVLLHPSTNAGLTLAASEGMYRYQDQLFQQTYEWQYDRKKNSFEPIVLNDAKLTRSN
jgi:hypothetical protein